MSDQEPAELPDNTGAERPTLEGFVDVQRNEIKELVAGLSEVDVRQRRVPSLTTLIGLIKHCAAVERVWFQHRLLGIPRDQVDGLANADDRSWAAGDDETIADVLAEYDAACEISRRNAARFPLDHLVQHEHFGPVSLRWIHLHMIRELARHAGHGDILREQIEAEGGTASSS